MKYNTVLPAVLTRFLLCTVCILCSSNIVQGGPTTRTWDGGANDGNWNSSNNWSADIAPTAADIAAFATSFGSGGTTIDLGGDKSVLSLSITNTTAFSLNNNILTLANGDITRSATTGTTTINSGLLLGGDGAWNIAGSATNGTLVVNGVIDDGASTFALDKTGSGTLTLNNANTFGGNLLLNAGTLAVGNNSALGGGTLDLSGGTLQASGAARTLANTVSVTANSTIGGSLDLTFNGDVSESNSFTLAVTNTGITTFAGSTLTLAPNNAPDNLTFDVDGASGGVVVNSVVQDGTGSGADGVIKTGTGSLTLSNSNTFTGNLTLDQGTLILGHNSAAGLGTLDLSGGTIQGVGGIRTISNNLAITGNNTFAGSDLIFTDSFDQVNDRIYTVNNTTTFSGVISGGDNLTKAGTGSLVLSGPNSYTGTTTISAGTLRVGANAPSGSSGALGNATSEVAFGVAGGNDNASLLANGAYTIGRNIRLATSNNTDAGTRVLTLGGDTADNSVFSGNITLGTTNQTSRGVTLTAGNGGQVTFSGVIQNPTGQSSGEATAAAALVAVTKTGLGAVVLSNANTYTGSTSVTAGTLFANNTTGSATGTGAISVGSNGKLGGSGFIVPTDANGINVSGVLSPGGSVNTPGNLTLNLGSTSGKVTMSSGSGFEFLLGTAGVSIVSVGVSDLLTLAGAAANDFAFNGNNVDFLNSGALGFYKLFDTSSNNANTWTGLTFDGTTGVVSSGLTYSNLASGLSGAFIVGTAGNGGTTGDIYFQVVPEPGDALLGGLGTLLLLRRRRAA
jgi:autotransporter-associated beta strand protein